MKILVIDDSEDIRVLLGVYCRQSPYCLAFAENGERAVAAYQAGAYNLIVMDVQMPVMDGLAAMRQIRAIERTTGRKRISILALSGNSLEQDSIWAVEAGFDMQLKKPIAKKTFLDALEQWLPSGPEIRIPEGLDELADTYLAKCRQEISDVQGLLARSAFEELRRLAHNLKGSGSSYGFPDITRLGARMEKACLDRNLTELSGHLIEMSAYIDAAQIQLENFDLAAH